MNKMDVIRIHTYIVSILLVLIMYYIIDNIVLRYMEFRVPLNSIYLRIIWIMWVIYNYKDIEKIVRENLAKNLAGNDAYRYIIIEIADIHQQREKVHKSLYFESLSADIYKAVHKRRYWKSIDSDLLPVAWHPNRVVDWCFNEDEKCDLKRLWGEL